MWRRGGGSSSERAGRRGVGRRRRGSGKSGKRMLMAAARGQEGGEIVGGEGEGRGAIQEKAVRGEGGETVGAMTRWREERQRSPLTRRQGGCGLREAVTVTATAPAGLLFHASAAFDSFGGELGDGTGSFPTLSRQPASSHTNESGRAYSLHLHFPVSLPHCHRDRRR
jgi:hypothetical protein